jgi:hypothetical protein
VRGQDVAEQGVERLHDMRARGGCLGDLLCGRAAVRRDEPRETGTIEWVGDVNNDFAGQCVTVLAYDRRGAGVRHRQDDDVSGRGGADSACRGVAAERTGQASGLASVTPDDLDGVAACERDGAQNAGHVSQADDADAAHGVCLPSGARKRLIPQP